MGKRITRETRITSTSDVTVGDLVDAVAERIGEGASRATIERVVKETVRPCAIGKVPTVAAAGCDAGCDGGSGGVPGLGGTVAGDGNTKRFTNGKLRGADPLEGKEIEGVNVGKLIPQPDGKFNLGTEDDAIRRVAGATERAGRGAAHMSGSARWFDAVLQNGEVWTPYTSRRFLPAQYLGLMLFGDGNVDAAIARRYTLRDCWRLLDTEIEKLIFMDKHWHSAFVERCRFLPVGTIQEIFREYLDGLDRNVNDRDKCTFTKRSGEYWRRIQGEGRVVLWKLELTANDGDNGAHTETTAIEPTDWLVELNDKIRDARYRLDRCNTYAKALDLLRNHLPRVSMGTFKDHEGYTRSWLPKSWKEAFKKQGAYYTLKSLIVNCHVRYTTEGGDWRRRTTDVAETARAGLDKLATLLDERTPAYVVHAILKKSIESARFDIAKFLRGIRR